jgi:signal transduction histidine kinase
MGRSFPVHAVLQEVRHGTSRIAEIVGALNAYSYVGQAPVQTVNLNEGIRHTLIILKNKLKRGVTVTLELDPDLPQVQAYGAELNQVWTNLIDNAIDAMDGHGTLRVVTRRDDDHVVVDIADSGNGMTADVQARAFEPFFTTKDVGKGTGLGLDISRRIVVDRHGGDIGVDSSPGSTTITVRLPLRR